MKKTILALAVSATLAAPAFAEEMANAPALTDEAREFLEQGATVKDMWWVNEHLIGIALESAPGQGLVVFADATGQYLISGTAIDSSSGINIAEAAMKERFPQPGPEEMYAEAERLAWVEVGGGRTGEPIYIVADTQCGYCHQVARAIAENDVNRPVRWILVGYLGPKSTNQAAGLLEAPEKQAASGLWKLLTGQAGGAPEQAPSKGARQVAANERWAQKWGVRGTPALLVPHQGQVHRVNGLPGEQMWEIISP